MTLVNIGDIELGVVDVGSGIPLLLVHGFPLDHSMWRYQIEEFAPHCRVIAPDLRGFGKSGVTPGTVTMEKLADDLIALLDALHIQDRVIFCGLSMGGYVGWQFARKYQDRLLALVACDTRVAADTSDQAANRRQLAERVMSEGPGVAADAMLPKLFSPAAHQHRPELIEQTRQVIVANHPQGIAATLGGMAVRADVTDLLPQIEVPTLVVVGELDEISTPDEMEAIAEALPNSAWVVVPGAGHMSPLENPEVFNKALAGYITL